MQGFGLSPQQRRSWALQQASGDGSPYRVRYEARLDGVERQALTAALRDVVARHEILRTTFQLLPGMSLPLQVISEESAPEILRAKIATVGSLRHSLTLELPAMCIDAAGMEHLLCEVGRRLDGTAAEMDGEEPIQYADLAQWLNELLESDETEAGREFWRRQDLRALTEPELPFERLAEDGRAFVPESLEVEVAEGRARAIESVVASRGVTPDVWLLACWQVLLARWTGQRRLVMGVALDGRNYAELERAIGLFERSLPLPCEVREGQDFAGFALQVSEAVAKHAQWQQYFAWKTLAEVCPQAPEAAPGVIYVPCGFEFWAPPALPPSATFSILRRDSCADRFLVKLRGDQSSDRLTLGFHYNASRLAAADVRRLAASFEVLLESTLQNPGAALFDLELVSVAERPRPQRTPVVAAPSRSATVHGVFEHQAAENPQARAVRHEATVLTYAELNAEANALAHHLRRLGIARESRVALCLERSAAMVTAMLAVLKAGGAYVPLDPSLPEKRLEFMLKDSGAALLVTRLQWAQSLDRCRVPAVLLDADAEAIHACSGANPEAGTGAGDLAYVMYTSGSTGRPKGVAIEHRQILAYFGGLSERLEVVKGASMAMVSTFAADLGLTSLYASLLSGGCLDVVSQQRATAPEALAEHVERHPVAGLKIVPSHLRALLGASRPARVLPRSFLVLGGEKLGWDLVDTLAELAPNLEVFNHYGPTETTIGVSTFRVGSSATRRRSVPLGRPLPHCDLLVLNSRLRAAPSGVAGELLIGGAGLARGYHDRPALTAARFVPHAMSAVPGVRLYKTGDLARWAPDGQLDFFGRVDQQVKIRGFRVELEEIERVLIDHPAVRAAVVASVDDQAGAARLVAYVVARSKPAPAPEDLRRHLRERLPDYMVPSHVLFLETLPLTANGKLDRQALPAPAWTESHGPSRAHAPRTTVEELVASLWSQLLQVDRVGLTDNFFDLGGHSLLAMQMSSRIRQTFGIELPLGEVFEASSLAALARGIEGALQAAEGFQAPPLRACSERGDAPLSFAQQRHWILQQVDPQSPLYNMSGALRVRGLLDTDYLRAGWREIIRRHEVLRTAFPVVEGEPRQRVVEVPELPAPLVDLESLGEAARVAAARKCVARLDAQPFELSRAPMIRVTLLRLAEDDHVMVVNLHHIVADRWTLEILLRELSLLYQALTEGRRSPLPRLELQYADFARWQRQWLLGEKLEAEVAFWRRELAGAPSILELAGARPRPSRLSGRSDRVPVPVSRESSAELRRLSRRQDATLFQTLLTAFQVLLHHHGGGDDLVVGAPIANRTRVETEGLVGCFINALALRARMAGDPTFRELLAQVRQTVLRGYTHQELPFERLVQELQPKRHPGASPIFQVVFNFAKGTMDPMLIPGLDLTPWERENTLEGKYDLILTMVDTDEGLQAFLTYSLDLFDAAVIKRMAANFQLLLQWVAEEPESRLSDLRDRLVEQERRSRLASAKEMMTARKKKLAGARRDADYKVPMEVSR